MNILTRLIDATDPTMSLKHAAYALVVVSAIGWLTWDMIRGPITTEWNFAFGLLLGAVTTGKIVGSGASPAPIAVVEAVTSPSSGNVAVVPGNAERTTGGNS